MVASRGGDHLRSEPSFEFAEDAEEGLRRFGVAESAFPKIVVRQQEVLLNLN